MTFKTSYDNIYIPDSSSLKNSSDTYSVRISHVATVNTVMSGDRLVDYRYFSWDPTSAGDCLVPIRCVDGHILVDVEAYCSTTNSVDVVATVYRQQYGAATTSPIGSTTSNASGFRQISVSVSWLVQPGDMILLFIRSYDSVDSFFYGGRAFFSGDDLNLNRSF